jgi:hypothetical protein
MCMRRVSGLILLGINTYSPMIFQLIIIDHKLIVLKLDPEGETLV